MIYLLRHCEKTAEAARAPQSDAGLRQANSIVPTLAKYGIKHIYCSPFLRAQQSAAPFAKAAGLTIKTSDALKEWRLSGTMQDDWQAVLARGLADPTVRATGGETAAEVWSRAKILLQPKLPTLLVTHGGWLTVVLGHYGRTCNLKNLLAIKSPDLFSIGPNGYRHHEL